MYLACLVCLAWLSPFILVARKGLKTNLELPRNVCEPIPENMKNRPQVALNMVPKSSQNRSKTDPKKVQNRLSYKIRFQESYRSRSCYQKAAQGTPKATPKTHQNPPKIDQKTMSKSTSISNAILDPLGVDFWSILDAFWGPSWNTSNLQKS